MKKFIAIGECMVEFSIGRDGGDSWTRGFAGDTFNTVYHMKALQVQGLDLSYCTVIGTDETSEAMFNFVKRSGIGTGKIGRNPNKTLGLYTISLKDGERSFSYWRNHSAARTLVDDPKWLRSQLAGADALYFSGITLAILSPASRQTFFEIISECKDRGAFVAFDPNFRSALWEFAGLAANAVKRAAGLSNVVLTSVEDEALLFEDSSLSGIASRYANSEVVVKDGSKACAWIKGETVLHFTPKFVKPLDTTGAGDGFNAGFLSLRLCGASIADAMECGMKLAAQIVSTFGALLPLPQELS